MRQLSTAVVQSRGPPDELVNDSGVSSLWLRLMTMCGCSRGDVSCTVSVGMDRSGR